MRRRGYPGEMALRFEKGVRGRYGDADADPEVVRHRVCAATGCGGRGRTDCAFDLGVAFTLHFASLGQQGCSVFPAEHGLWHNVGSF